MNPNLEGQCREMRLVFWERILRGIPVDPIEIDREILPLVIDSSPMERMAFILLRAAATLASTGTVAVRRTLRIATVYWFSNTGVLPAADEEAAIDLSSLSLHNVVGLGLTWREAALAFGVNPRDYSAYQRLLHRLKSECASQWKTLFGKSMENMIEGIEIERR